MMKFAVVLFVFCTMLLMVESNVLREAQPNRDVYDSYYRRNRHVNDPAFYGDITLEALTSQVCLYLCKLSESGNCKHDCGHAV